ncbi:MAG: peptide deformylase [Ignavibacteriaceae bacterium]|nr:peptide deformylase [Ignavibacteriaceae bacterium]
MSVIPINVYGDKILRKKAQSVSNIDFLAVELIKNMFETMRHANGVGLAATQVGIDQSIFVVDLSQVEDYEKFKPMVFINPKILDFSDKKVSIEEGCLSIPNVRYEVQRPESIYINYFDTNLKEHTLEADKFLARVIQHEQDHLNGVLFTDHLDEDAKKKLKKSLEKIKKREIEIDYPIVQKENLRLK